MNYKKIGKFIASLRNEKHLTQEQLAQQLFVDRSLISKWERGAHLPSPEMLFQLSNFFEISVNELLLGEKERKDNQTQVNQVTINILKQKKKDKKRFLIILISSFIIFLLLFLGYYFINTYNSIAVYKISGQSEHFYINDGILIQSNEKMYLNISTIRSIGQQRNPISIKLYYLQNGEKQIILEKNFKNPLLLIMNYNDSNRLFSRSEFDDMMYHLYLELTYLNDSKKNQTETIELHLKKDFANVSLP